VLCYVVNDKVADVTKAANFSIQLMIMSCKRGDFELKQTFAPRRGRLVSSARCTIAGSNFAVNSLQPSVH
jgi:hypothetical protein